MTGKDRKPGPFPYYGAAGIQDFVHDYLFEGLHVLLGEDGTVITENGKPIVQLVDGQFWVNNHAHVWQAGSDTDTRYLSYALSRIDVGPYISGAVQPNHGRIPRALQQLSVRLFNEGLLQFLVCTSTLIEGVNTAAKTVIIYDNKIATRKYDFFTFNNIKGRAGRMRQHFVGRVYIFNPPPEEELPMVDIPVVSQPDDLPLQVVVEMDEADLTTESAERLSGVTSQSVLPLAIIRENVGVDPLRQVEFARSLRNRSVDYLRVLAWKGYPNSDELRALCAALWDSFLRHLPRGTGGILSAAQLQRGLRIASRLRLKEWIDQEVGASDEPADDVVERILDFARNYCGFRFPRYARAAERIIKFEQSRRGLPLANYAFFINQVESFFLPPIATALDEFGVPSQISTRLVETGALSDDLDEAVEQLESAARAGILTEFESRLVLNALGLEDFALPEEPASNEAASNRD